MLHTSSYDADCLAKRETGILSSPVRCKLPLIEVSGVKTHPGGRNYTTHGGRNKFVGRNITELITPADF